MELLDEVKEFLNFTWTDEAHERRIVDYIKSSQDYLNGVYGQVLDYTDDSLARELLFNRVLYMDNHALSDFAENYNGLLNELKIHGSVNNASCKED